MQQYDKGANSAFSRRLTMDNAVVLDSLQPLLDAEVRMGGHDASGGDRHRVLHPHSCVTHTREREGQGRAGFRMHSSGVD